MSGLAIPVLPRTGLSMTNFASIPRIHQGTGEKEKGGGRPMLLRAVPNFLAHAFPNTNPNSAIRDLSGLVACITTCMSESHLRVPKQEVEKNGYTPFQFMGNNPSPMVPFPSQACYTQSQYILQSTYRIRHFHTEPPFPLLNYPPQSTSPSLPFTTLHLQNIDCQRVGIRARYLISLVVDRRAFLLYQDWVYHQH